MDYPTASSSSSTSSKTGQDSTFGGIGSQGSSQPYHITHGATAYQQITRRTERQPSLFSSSGFDIIGVLTRVASRPNPTVFIGPVDFSCAFVVSDAKPPKFPVVYASPNLEKMTGYNVAEFIGRSCSFLQWPNGGKKLGESHAANNQARLEIKQALSSGTECQTQLINYRKNGEMFLNFVTIVPITWDSSEIKFFVGFQVDISEPSRLYPKKPPMQTINVLPSNSEAPISSRLKALIGPAPSVEEQRESLFDFILTNMDDFVIAVSSDGIIHQAAGRIVESIGWESWELVGGSIACFIHPADVESVHNELSSFRFIPPPPRTSSSVDIAAYYTHQNRILHLLYRAVVKRSASARVWRNHPHKRGPLPNSSVLHVWLESRGRIHIESPGKTLLILSTRIVHVPQLTYAQVESADGFRPHATGVWAQVSLCGGIILSASPENETTRFADPTRSPSTAKDLFGVPPSTLVGTRLHDWVSHDFVPSIDSAFHDIRRGNVKRFSSWSKPRQVMAMMPNYERPAPDKALGFGKPILITIFPPDSANATPATIPVHTSIPLRGEAAGDYFHGMASCDPGTDSKENAVPSLPASLICRLSSPLQVLPDGMSSPMDTPRTNQAYLHDPFGALSAQKNVIPRRTHSQTANSNTTYGSSLGPVPPHMSVSLSLPLLQRQRGSEDVFEQLSAFADGTSRWEDQLEMLRVHNARLQGEIDELLCTQQTEQLSTQAQ